MHQGVAGQPHQRLPEWAHADGIAFGQPVHRQLVARRQRPGDDIPADLVIGLIGDGFRDNHVGL